MPSTARVNSGISALDVILHGGFPAGRSVLVTGAPGSGKTTVGLQFIAAGVKANERAALVLVDQKPRHLIADARLFGWDLEEWMRRKLLLLLDASPFFTAARRPARELEARDVAADLAGQVKSFGAGRLVIDPITSIVTPDNEDNARDFMRAMMLTIEDALGCTTVLTASPASDRLTSIVSDLTSGWLELGAKRTRDGFLRTLQVNKMRGTAVDPTELYIALRDGEGIVTARNQESGVRSQESGIRNQDYS